MTVRPWPPHHRRLIKARIDDAARRAKDALGAHDVLIVAWFQDITDPTVLHMQDGGTSPMPNDQVYHYMAANIDQMKEQGEGYTEQGMKLIGGSSDGKPN